MAFRGNMRGSPNNGSYNQILENQNDNKVDELHGKVAALKRITLDIGDEVRSQNRLLNDMDGDFDSGRGLLDGAMKRLGIVGRSGGKNMLLYLIGFSLFVFFVIYCLAKRG